MTDSASSRATLSEVAAAAGVSLKTASRALGGEPHVTPATRERVMTAAAELGYARNAAASLLASGHRSETVGFITGDLSNPFYSQLARGLEGVLRESGLQLSVASSEEDPDTEWSLAQAFARAQARALIVASALRDHSRYAEFAARGIPVVFVDRAPMGLVADTVTFADVDGGALAARHLTAHGHHRIGFIGDFAWLPTSRGRLAGIAGELDRSPRDRPDSLIRSGAHDAAAASRVAAEFLALAEPPTALIAGNNRIMLGVAQHVSTIAESQRPATLGFDDFEWSEVIGATVVTGDAVSMGEEAARLALLRMSARDRDVDMIRLPMTLIPRGSAERAPVRRGDYASPPPRMI